MDKEYHFWEIKEKINRYRYLYKKATEKIVDSMLGYSNGQPTLLKMDKFCKEISFESGLELKIESDLDANIMKELSLLQRDPIIMIYEKFRSLKHKIIYI